MKRNKNIPFILFLCLFLLIYLVVNAMQSIKVYFVYSSGLGPLLFIGFIISVIIVLYLKGIQKL
ncbi:hypothetical protein JMM81_20560 [Bacillus sp. V3B]|uniref:hypothetical protein n=1 Tax=Bacillus sp. V3B TaxID=2804915 RepID=UPI002108DF77|nr:hypothetical protein [Bacillus sp. V3B]MCQ6277270.1 hypothetical protein [Bacillus sp. V3B]